MKYNTKVDIVYQTIRTDIERGLYLPGDKIVISRIAKQCDCSEIPVREALRRLESEKVIKLIPNKGAVVSSLSKNYLEQLFAVKMELESFAAKLSVGKMSEAQFKKLRKMVVEMDKAFEEGNLKQSASLNYKFHMLIYRAGGNDVLADYIDEMWNKWPRGHYSGFVPDEWYLESNRQHLKIIDAIEAGDLEQIEQLIRSHKSGALSNLGKREEAIAMGQ